MKKTLIPLFSAVLLSILLISCGDDSAKLYLTDTAPAIDGDFSEYQELKMTTTKVAVGRDHEPEDAEGAFALLSDNENLYVYASVIDDKPIRNINPPEMGWKGDSVEIFIGTNTEKHISYKKGDNQIRIIPRKKGDIFAFALAINEQDRTAETEAAVVFGDNGYQIEARIPLSIMSIEPFTEGQAIRCEFQVNDADHGERDRIVHWKAPKDNPWNNTSAWSDGTVTK